VPDGQTVEKEAVIDVGHVVANAYYVSGGEKADSSGVSFTVLRAEKQTDGTREQVAYGYGPDSKFDLPEGDYVIEATVDLALVEQPFSVKAGEDQALKVAVNAGVLAITAPGANRIEIFEAKRDANGNRKSVGYAYDEKFQPSVLAGDYVIVVEKSGSGTPKESTATVKAGERTQITVP
jgi:Ca-activated chloride channel family protein